MGVCRRCGKRGLLLITNQNGLCPGCAQKESERKAEVQRMLEESRKRIEQGDLEIQTLNEARAKYDAGGDINECINVFQDILSRDTEWNKFGFWLSLIALYERAGDYDKAWESIERTAFYSVTAGFPLETMLYHVQKLDYERYKISKHEKRYYDALRSLVGYYALKSGMESGRPFDYKAFWKEGRTMFKKMKLTDEQIDDLTQRVCKIEPSPNVASEAGALVPEWMKDHKLGMFSDSK